MDQNDGTETRIYAAVRHHTADGIAIVLLELDIDNNESYICMTVGRS